MYMLITTTILVILGVLAYYLFIKEKSQKLDLIEKGICPRCENETIELKRNKSGGCSGTSNVIYRCSSCGYEEDFNVSTSCFNGRCGL